MIRGSCTGIVDVVGDDAGEVVTGDVVTGEVVTGDVVTGVASVVVGSESDDEPEHADSTKMLAADVIIQMYLLTVTRSVASRKILV